MNKKHLTGTVPVNKKHLTGTVPVNKKHLTGTLFIHYIDGFPSSVPVINLCHKGSISTNPQDISYDLASKLYMKSLI